MAADDARVNTFFGGWHSAPPGASTYDRDLAGLAAVDALTPLHTAATLIECIVIGDEGQQRERTVALLVLHSTGRYTGLDIERFAHDAMQDARQPGTPWDEDEVAAALRTLGIEVPE